MREQDVHLRKNRALWDRLAPEFVGPGEREWNSQTPSWGIWNIPEAEVGLLPENLAGMEAIELGCGTAYVSAWLARRGARVVGIDMSPRQLGTARRLQHRHELRFPLIHGNAEKLPFRDGSFDFAISEYGACLWADPYRWIPEAARVLRPGGRLVFLTNSFLMALCTPEQDGVAATDRLLRPSFGMHSIEWPGDHGVEFHLSHGTWIRLLCRSGFGIEDLLELRPGDRANSRYPHVTLDWARRWPCEEAWRVRRLRRR